MLEQLYYKPETLNDAALLLNRYGKEAKILAGGTDLIINLRENMISCKYLIDIKKISEMQKIKFTNEEGLSIGGAVSLNEIIENEDIKENYPILIEAAKTLANSLLRNRATLIGNICNASPAGDMLTPSLALEGTIEALSTEGTRLIPLKDFFLGVKKTALKENEIAVRLLIPIVKGTGCYLRKSRIKGHDLAQINVAGFLRDDGKLNLALGAVAPTPLLLDCFEGVTKSSLKDEEYVKVIMERVMSSVNPISDQRASREYRIAMAKYLTSMVLMELAKEV